MGIEIMNPESTCVLITGATGFLGTQIIQRLLNETKYEIMVLVRGEDKLTALNRLKRAWWEFSDLKSAIGQRIYLLNGDITQNQLALTDDQYENLITSVTHIIHTAADLRLNAPLEDLRKTNREGTINILQLAHKIHKKGKLIRFSHVSTAYVAGRRKGYINEDSLTDEAGFLSNYERSKYASELEVKKSKLPLSIFRPGMIVGDSKTGYIKTFNTFYTPLRLYLSGKQRIVPIKPTEKINIIPVDYVADAVASLTFNPSAEGLTFHLTAPNDSQPTVDELIKFTMKWAFDNLNFKLPKPIFAPILAPLISRFSNSKLISNPRTKKKLETINTLAPYFNEDRQFSLENTEKLLGHYQLNWKNFMPKILEFAVYMGFFHRSERTVHEQILFRLKSRSRPVQYYDIIDGKYEARSTSKIREEMYQAARSLRKLNIGRGDRVAIVGHNSTRYLILDVAIGLIGAVSVPLYYTSSINEIKEILKDCEAYLFFIGVPDILNNLKEWNNSINLISFSDEPEIDSNIMGWNEFIKLAGDSDYELSAPVDLDDLATIRYTSGTTGRPRGVMFTHDKLRWMAEYISSMPPWKNRNEDVSYLSFLPMNHVVEGIMGLYGPYYAPAPLNLYFLKDFQYLPQALPRVKPNIFFSVPRFYEKVWSEVTENRIGKIYLKSSDGLTKNLLGRLIKRTILKKTGLNRCAQLIVGSAPISEDLLKSYHDLGIEIYNAYGLTEAPLLTINRLGNNRIGTVGESLPSTEIDRAPDGEVIVKGPQVMSGYLNSDLNKHNSPFKDGWLQTGDFGYITPEGSLVITGRKKELLVNSYGKTISPLKIESILKDIPQVAEALLIGESKPYCSSLLWFEDESIDMESIKTAIEDINHLVSRPEEIKKWVALKNDLSIENGDLTANLKLKRMNIINRYVEVIDYIYENGKEPEEILYLGVVDGENGRYP
ncbi:MAG: AMP-binding protein [Methanobacterium sp.]|nr:AMP-binding protein [Methanobacterium sp.]